MMVTVNLNLYWPLCFKNAKQTKTGIDDVCT